MRCRACPWERGGGHGSRRVSIGDDRRQHRALAWRGSGTAHRDPVARPTRGERRYAERGRIVSPSPTGALDAQTGRPDIDGRPSPTEGAVKAKGTAKGVITIF